MPVLLIVIVAIALLFDFLNGLHDSSNIVATMISSRAMAPRSALGISAVAHFAGPFLFGVAVASTIGHEVVEYDSRTANGFSDCIRAARGTEAAAWPAGTPIREMGYTHPLLVDVMLGGARLETTLGIWTAARLVFSGNLAVTLA